ncbi:MAG TPA: hypothetical protein VGM59_07300 [Dongiaceae bacterium]
MDVELDLLEDSIKQEFRIGIAAIDRCHEVTGLPDHRLDRAWLSRAAGRRKLFLPCRIKAHHSPQTLTAIVPMPDADAMLGLTAGIAATAQ